MLDIFIIFFQRTSYTCTFYQNVCKLYACTFNLAWLWTIYWWLWNVRWNLKIGCTTTGNVWMWNDLAVKRPVTVMRHTCYFVLVLTAFWWSYICKSLHFETHLDLNEIINYMYMYIMIIIKMMWCKNHCVHWNIGQTATKGVNFLDTISRNQIPRCLHSMCTI